MKPEVDASGWSEWPAPAKLNLFLRITGRRPDGYHLLQTVFQMLAWGDTIRLRVRADGVVRRIDGIVRPAWATADADLAVRAARLLKEASGTPLGADILVEKRIPVGGGFGGGSSDAATVLVALDRLWDTRFGTDRLAEMGLRLGADVPVFVRGENAWAEGIGEELTPIALPAQWFLVVDPGVHVPTAALFQDPGLTRDATAGTMHGFACGADFGNDFEPVLRRREPEIGAALDALAPFGTARVTGSGGGCFVAFDTREAAEAARAALPDRWTAWIAQGAPRSSLLDRLEQML